MKLKGIKSLKFENKGAFGRPKNLRNKCRRVINRKNSKTGKITKSIVYRHHWNFRGICRVCGAKKEEK